MSDVDALIAKKEAEYETLSRATAALLENHENERANFKVEMEKKREKAAKDLEKELKDTKNELKDVLKLVAKAQSEYNDLVSKTDKHAEKAKSKLESTMAEKAVVEGVVGQLKTEELSLTSEITVLKSKVGELNTNADNLRATIGDLDQKKYDKQNELEALNADIEQAQLEFNLEKSSYDKEIDDAKNRLTQLHAELNDANRSLVEVRSQEESVRQDIADRYKDIQNREEAVLKRENQVRISEKRVYNYQQFTKL